MTRHWLETITGPVPGMHELVAALDEAGVPLFAITNFSDELWARFRPTAPIFDRFRDIVVSGTEKLWKPEAAIYRLARQRFGLAPGEGLFIDDRIENVRGGEAEGFPAIILPGRRGYGSGWWRKGCWRRSLAERAVLKRLRRLGPIRPQHAGRPSLLIVRLIRRQFLARQPHDMDDIGGAGRREGHAGDEHQRITGAGDVGAQRHALGLFDHFFKAGDIAGDNGMDAPHQPHAPRGGDARRQAQHRQGGALARRRGGRWSPTR